MLKITIFLVALSLGLAIADVSENYDLAQDRSWYDDYSYYDDDYQPEVQDKTIGIAAEAAGINPLAALIAPLAGLALLGAAAAVSINPVLVQLAVVSSGRRRKKRDITNPEINSLAEDQKLTEIGVLERFLATETNFDEQAQNMVARYVECSGLQENKCLERLVCIYATSEETVSPKEKEVISIILYQLMSNKYMKNETKTRMRHAGQLSKFLGGHCKKYYCPTLDGQN